MWSPPGLSEIWDALVFAFLLPIVVLVGVSLPGDWTHHSGGSLPGTATVTELEAVRGGYAPMVEIRSAYGSVVARDQEVNGQSVEQVGASFPVEYLPVDESGDTQVYAIGHDPFHTNLTVFVLATLVWLTSVPFVVARLVKAVRRARNRHRRQAGQYSAGRGYVSD